MSKLKELLEGVEVGWKPLARNENAVAELCRGRVMSKSFLEENIGVYPVYSSQTANNGEIGSINTFDFDGEPVYSNKLDEIKAIDIWLVNEVFNIPNKRLTKLTLKKLVELEICLS